LTALPPIARRSDESRQLLTPDAQMRAVLRDPDDITLAAYLADAGRILGSSLDSAATLRQIADLIVPGLVYDRPSRRGRPARASGARPPRPRPDAARRGA
jgi:hypothetical protein